MKTCNRCGESKPIDAFYKKYAHCKACRRVKTRAWETNNRERRNLLSRVRYKNDPETHRMNQQRYHEKYPQRSTEIMKAYRQRNPEKIKEYSRKRRASDSAYRLKCNISCGIRLALRDGLGKRGKSTTRILNILGYSIDELKDHLESKFQAGMTWDNYGKPNGEFFAGWHIDHIEPVCSFNFKSIEDEDFKKCWTLSNLRPLWARENLSKMKEDKKKKFKPTRTR